MMGYVLTLAVGIVLGGFLGYWFEDVLRGPVMRCYDEGCRGEIVLLDED